MVSIDELRRKYLVRVVPPHGECIIVPGTEFDPDWEVYLVDRGFKCFMTDLDGRPVTLVRLKKPFKSAEPEIRVEPVKASRRGRGFSWVDEDLEMLVGLWNQRPKLTVEKIAEYFPGRSAKAVTQTLKRLREKGVIERRHVGPPREPKESGQVVAARLAGTDPPTPQPMQKEARPSVAPKAVPTSVPSFSTAISINIHVDCGNPASVEAFRRLMKELLP